MKMAKKISILLVAFALTIGTMLIPINAAGGCGNWVYVSADSPICDSSSPCFQSGQLLKTYKQVVKQERTCIDGAGRTYTEEQNLILTLGCC